MLQALLLCACFCGVQFAHADTVYISNSVSATSNGGSASAHVQTVINGEEVTNISQSGSEVSIETSSYATTEAEATAYSEETEEVEHADVSELETLLQTLLELLRKQYAILSQ